jgi:hypothetical protein
MSMGSQMATTASGSTYEVDVVLKRARRLSGPNAPTSRMPDGVWRTFVGMLPSEGPEIGKSMLFHWADQGVGVPAIPGAEPATITSHVLEVF